MLVLNTEEGAVASLILLLFIRSLADISPVVSVPLGTAKCPELIPVVAVEAIMGAAE